MKHRFPPNTWVYCYDIHTQKEGELFVELARKVGLTISEDTLENLCDISYPGFCWNGRKIVQHCKTNFDGVTNVSLEDFFKLLNIAPNISQMRELFATV